MELARREDIWLRPMRADDLGLLVRWRNEPHVRRWWEMDGDPVPLTLADAEEELGPVLRGEEPASAAIVVLGERPVGYVQWYRWADYAKEVAATGIPDDGGTFGLDILVGEPDVVGTGIGSIAVDLVCHLVFEEHGGTGVALLTAVGNAGARRAYEKAGFRRIRRALDTDVRDGHRVESWLMVRARG